MYNFMWVHRLWALWHTSRRATKNAYQFDKQRTCEPQTDEQVLLWELLADSVASATQLQQKQRASETVSAIVQPTLLQELK